MRVMLFVALVVLIRHRHVTYRAEQVLARQGGVPAAILSQFYPGSPKTGPWDARRGAQAVTNAGGETLGFVVQTSPESDHIVGYVGPTNVLIAFDRDYRVLGMKVLDSEDTLEHLRDVTGSQRFMAAYEGLSWQQAAAKRDVQAVSGATLTSLAIIESISNRLGNPCPSLRFPEELRVEEIKPYVPAANSLRQRPRFPLVHDVLDAQQRRVGAVVRTSPTCDGVPGYQGPTDTLLVMDSHDRIIRLVVRSSYDNQPYVRYVQEDEYFCTYFNDLSLSELAEFDPETAGVEGVSGATMTSMGVADSIRPAAQAALQPRQPRPSVVVAARDVGTCLMLVAALVMTFTHLRGNRRLQLLFRVLLVVYLGFLNGDLLSQALLVGWAQSGVPWRLAPGLVLLSAAALIVPVLSKRQFYCHHVCPFGAAQQLVRMRSPWLRPLPRRLHQGLSLIPAALLVLVVLTAMLHLPINLAGIEPFDAFVFWIAGIATLTVFAFGLLASAVTPMAYCRYGCPTGSLLDYLRRHARSDRLSRRDAVAGGLLLLALVLA